MQRMMLNHPRLSIAGALVGNCSSLGVLGTVANSRNGCSAALSLNAVFLTLLATGLYAQLDSVTSIFHNHHLQEDFSNAQNRFTFRRR